MIATNLACGKAFCTTRTSAHSVRRFRNTISAAIRRQRVVQASEVDRLHDKVDRLHDKDTSDIRTSSQEDYREVCTETVKAIADSLKKSCLQPETIDLIGIMQDVGRGMGLKVEYSRGRIVTAKAGVAHQLAESNLKRRLDDEQGWKMLNGIHLTLPCGTRRQPDISGWRNPIKFDHRASQLMQRPDWVCEILSAKTKKQDLPDGDKFLEYAESGIPHYWIVDPSTGQISVYELVVDEFRIIQKVSLNENSNSALSPFGTKFDLEQLFEYML